MAFNLELPDGTTLHDVPDGTTRAQIVQKMQGNGMQVPKEWLTDQAPQGNDQGRTSAFINGLGSLIPGNERISAGLGAAMTKGLDATGLIDDKRSMGDIYQGMRNDQNTTDTAHSGAHIAGAVAPLAGSIPLALKGAFTEGVGLADKIPSAVGNIIRGAPLEKGAGFLAKSGNLGAQALKGATVAAPTGFAYGYGDGQEGHRVESGIDSAKLAAALGGAGPIAGATLGAGANAVKSIGGGIEQALRPLTESGRGKIIAQLLSEKADNPQAVVNNLNNIPEYVQNSPVTTGEASADPGIIALQRGIRNRGANPFADIESQQNAARSTALGDVAGNESDLAAALSSRANSAENLYKDAYSSGPVNSDRMQDFLSTPEIQAGIKRGLQIQRIESVAKGEKFNPHDYSVTGFNESGDPILGKVPNTRLLDAGKKGLDAMIAENTDLTGKVNEFGRAVTQLKKSYLDEIDNINPAYKAARGQFGELSKPINQMRTLQDIQNKVSMNAAPDVVTGHSFLSQPKLTGILKDPELAKTLTPEQLSTLKNIEADMVRSQSLNQRNIRASGSDTIANNNAGNAVGNMLAQSAFNKVPFGVGKMVQGMSEKKINEALVEALRNPDLAKNLIMKNLQKTDKASQLAQMLSNASPLLGPSKLTVQRLNQP